MTGAESLQLFQQLVANANSLFLSDADFVAINGISKPTLKKIYAEFLASMGTYTTVAAGLAATSGTGTNNRFFSVPGTDYVFETRYRNDAGVAVEISSLLSWLSDALTINKGKAYPLSQKTRGGVTSPANATVNKFLLSAKVIGPGELLAGKYFRLAYLQNGATVSGSAANGVILEEFDAATYSATGTAAVIHARTDTPASYVRADGGVQTFTITPASRPELTFTFTVDCSDMPPSGTAVNMSAPSGAQAYSWVIDPSCLIPISNIRDNPRYRNRGGSIVPNGSLRNAGAGNTTYREVFPDVAQQAPVKPIANSLLNGLGCSYAFALEAADTAQSAAWVSVDYSPAGQNESLIVFGSVLVFSPSGEWNFGPTQGPQLGRVLSNGTLVTARMTAFDELSANVRRYHLSMPWSDPGDPLFVSRFQVGMNTAMPRTADYFFTGLWITVVPASHTVGGALTFADTLWPNWASGAASGVVAAAQMESQLAIDRRLSQVEHPVGRGLSKLARALGNPLHSIFIGLMGDSISWGLTVTGQGPTEPRSHQLSDVRNNLTSPSWANLLRQYLGSTYSYGDVTEDAPGSGYYRREHTLDATNGDTKFRFVSAVSLAPIPASSVTKVTQANAFFGRYINLGTGQWVLEFDLVGDNLTVIYAGSGASDPASSKVAIVDADTGVELGSFLYGYGTTWSHTATVNFPYGKYRIQIRDVSPDKRFRFEGIKVNRKIQLANNGISGTWSAEWLPGTPLLNGGIPADAEFVFAMLGTNDRLNSIIPIDPVRTKDNMRKIVSELKGLRGKEVILMCANAVRPDLDFPDNSTTYKYSMQDVSRVLRDLAEEMDVDFIDHYRTFKMAADQGETLLRDGVHPNDAGHRFMFETIEGKISEEMNSYRT